MFSDASRNFDKGFGAYCGRYWTYGQWSRKFMEVAQPSIENLELYGVMMAVYLWIDQFQNRRICLFCDNISVVHMINNSSSKYKNCMVLIRIIPLMSMTKNVRVFAKYVTSKDNAKADALSQLNFSKFWALDPGMSPNPTKLPDDLWPISKIWHF